MLFYNPKERGPPTPFVNWVSLARTYDIYSFKNRGRKERRKRTTWQSLSQNEYFLNNNDKYHTNMCTLEEFSSTFDKWVSPLSKSLFLIFLAISAVFWGDTLKIQQQGTRGLPRSSLRLLNAVSAGSSIFLVEQTGLWGRAWRTEPPCAWMRLFSLDPCPPTVILMRPCG